MNIHLLSGEVKHFVISDIDVNAPKYWAIPTDYGFQFTNYDDGSIYRVSVFDISQDAVEADFDGIDCRPDDLHVIHLPFGGDLRVLETANQLIAQRFDLPARVFSVGYDQLLKGGLQRKGQGRNPAHMLLGQPFTVRHHAIIPRALWLQWRDDHARWNAYRKLDIGTDATVAKPQAFMNSDGSVTVPPIPLEGAA